MGTIKEKSFASTGEPSCETFLQGVKKVQHFGKYTKRGKEFPALGKGKRSTIL